MRGCGATVGCDAPKRELGRALPTGPSLELALSDTQLLLLGELLKAVEKLQRAIGTEADAKAAAAAAAAAAAEAAAAAAGAAAAAATRLGRRRPRAPERASRTRVPRQGCAHAARGAQGSNRIMNSHKQARARKREGLCLSSACGPLWDERDAGIRYHGSRGQGLARELRGPGCVHVRVSQVALSNTEYNACVVSYIVHTSNLGQRA